MNLALRLRTDGYRALEHDRVAQGGHRTWETRLLGSRAVVVRGRDGVRLFYDESVVERHRAVPLPLAGLLFGPGAVHGLDDDAHRERKELFLDVLRPARTPEVALDAARRLAAALDALTAPAPLHGILVRAYGGAVLGWAGLDVPPARQPEWSDELARIVDGFGFAIPAYPRGWVARARTDRWLRAQLRAARAGRRAPEDSALAVLAATDLPIRTAAVELNNVVRPTVAVSWLGVAAARALAGLPGWRDRVRDDAGVRHSFAQEVRRTAPFVPALAGRVRRPVTHDGVDLRTGDRVVLDVRAVNHDPLTWDEPHRFRPERFLDRQPGPYDMVPQGGGTPLGHRCPGESLTVQLLAETLRVLAASDVRVLVGSGPALDRMPPDPDHEVRVAP